MSVSEAVPVSDEELDQLYTRLHAAIAERQVEYGRQQRIRRATTWGIVIALLVILASLWRIVGSFDTTAFTDRFSSKLMNSSGSLYKDVQTSLSQLQPVYQHELERQMPGFSAKLTTTLTDESTKLTEVVAPMSKGDFSALTGDADEEMARRLAEAFPETFKANPRGAKALAVALRHEELTLGVNDAPGPLKGPFTTIREIQQTLATFGKGDADLSTADIVDAVGSAVVEVARTKLAEPDKKETSKPALKGAE